MNQTVQLAQDSSIPPAALEALRADGTLPVCVACGTQMPRKMDTCAICEDPRQFVPASGQAWTSLAELGQTRKNSLLKELDDDRLTLIKTEPGFGINQTPFLIETAGGSYIWDCAAFISPPLVAHLLSLKVPLKAMAISHPHFFTTSLTWARALNVPLYICAADKEWFQRAGDVGDKDRVVFWEGEVVLGEGVKLVQCGGHFPGSCLLYWDRLSEPAPSPLPTKPTPVKGIIFTADTIMVQNTQKGFAFVWSVPNMIPLGPEPILEILNKVEPLHFDQATSTWPDRMIRKDAKQAVKDSAVNHLRMIGWKMEGNGVVPLK